MSAPAQLLEMGATQLEIKRLEPFESIKGKLKLICF